MTEIILHHNPLFVFFLKKRTSLFGGSKEKMLESKQGTKVFFWREGEEGTKTEL